MSGSQETMVVGHSVAKGSEKKRQGWVGHVSDRGENAWGGGKGERREGDSSTAKRQARRANREEGQRGEKGKGNSSTARRQARWARATRARSVIGGESMGNSSMQRHARCRQGPRCKYFARFRVRG